VISTRDLSLLPDVEGLRALLQALATLDAIVCPEWEYRYWSFNCAWAPGEQMGSMRNGQGDDLFAHFSSAGCWLKGFDHESRMSPHARKPKRVWPGILDAVPADFASCLREPAFSVDDVTFCIWRRVGDTRWQIGPVAFPPGLADPDGSESLLSELDGRAETYLAFAGEYYEKDLDVSAVEHVHQHRPLTADVVALLNPQRSPRELVGDLDEIGYPLSNGFPAPRGAD